MKQLRDKKLDGGLVRAPEWDQWNKGMPMMGTGVSYAAPVAGSQVYAANALVR